VSLNESSETFGTHRVCLLKFFLFSMYILPYKCISKTENVHSMKKKLTTTCVFWDWASMRNLCRGIFKNAHNT